MNPQTPAYTPPGHSRKPLIVIIILSVLLVASVVFGFSAYTTGQDYKKNSDAKSATAVAVAEKAQAAELQKSFDEQSKNPYKTYQNSSAASGSITFNYPGTWSAYVDETSSSQLINGYFYPQQVPGVQSTTAFALRVELVSSDYAQVINSYTTQLKKGDLTALAYVPPLMTGVANVQTGTRFNGVIEKDKKGSLVVIKVRDKTLKIYTQSEEFLKDFNDIILASLKFAP